MLQSYLPLWSALAVAVGVVWGLLALGAQLTPRACVARAERRTARPKTLGVVLPPGGAPAATYGTVVLFVVGTTTASVLYPWAAVFRHATEGRGSLSPLVALLDMGVFGAMLLVGMVYAWRRGALAWYAGVQRPLQASALPGRNVAADAAAPTREDRL
jgi:NADH-quinone oxidoreductase subunit A